MQDSLVLGSVGLSILVWVVLLFFVMIIVLFVIEAGHIKKLNHWSKQLTHRTVRSEEFSELFEDVNVFKRMQNLPRYWTMCKRIYFASLNSKELSFEQKIQIYELFDRLGVQGIPYPKERPSEKREATIHDIF